MTHPKYGMVNAVTVQSERRARHRSRFIWQCTWFNAEWVRRRERRMWWFQFNLRWIVLIASNSKSMLLFACFNLLSSIRFSSALCSSYHMSQNNYAFRCVWTWLSFTWDSTDHITCHDAFRRYWMSCRPHFVYRHVHSTMRFNGLWASFRKKIKDFTKEIFSVCRHFCCLQNQKKKKIPKIHKKFFYWKCMHRLNTWISIFKLNLRKQKGNLQNAVK